MIVNIIIAVLVGLFVIFASSMLVLIVALNTEFLKRAQFLFMSSLEYSDEAELKVQTLLGMHKAGKYTVKFNAAGTQILFKSEEGDTMGAIRISDKYAGYAVLDEYRQRTQHRKKVSLDSFKRVLKIEKDLRKAQVKDTPVDDKKSQNSTNEITLD